MSGESISRVFVCSSAGESKYCVIITRWLMGACVNTAASSFVSSGQCITAGNYTVSLQTDSQIALPFFFEDSWRLNTTTNKSRDAYTNYFAIAVVQRVIKRRSSAICFFFSCVQCYCIVHLQSSCFVIYKAMHLVTDFLHYSLNLLTHQFS